MVQHKLFQFIIIALLILLTLKIVCQYIETRYFPVVSDFQITSYKDISIGWSEIYGNFQKFRNCPPVEVSMYYITPESIIPIQYIWLEAPIARKDGYQIFGPWHIQVPSANIQEVEIISKHNCHFFYNTTSRSKINVLETDPNTILE